MKDKVKTRLDAFALALGGVSVKSAYGAVPIVASDRINAAWDERLRKESTASSSDLAAEEACAGWAT